MVGVIGSLMYASTNIDFFHFVDSIKATNVYLYLLIFDILTPIVVIVETKAKDPILNILRIGRCL